MRLGVWERLFEGCEPAEADLRSRSFIGRSESAERNKNNKDGKSVKFYDGIWKILLSLRRRRKCHGLTSSVSGDCKPSRLGFFSPSTHFYLLLVSCHLTLLFLVPQCCIIFMVRKFCNQNRLPLLESSLVPPSQPMWERVKTNDYKTQCLSYPDLGTNIKRQHKKKWWWYHLLIGQKKNTQTDIKRLLKFLSFILSSRTSSTLFEGPLPLHFKSSFFANRYRYATIDIQFWFPSVNSRALPEVNQDLPWGPSPGFQTFFPVRTVPIGSNPNISTN
jgi:hypothetical protein